MQIGVRLNPPNNPETNPVDHFLASVNNRFEHVLQDMGYADMVDVAIHNEVNQSYRYQFQTAGSVIWRRDLECV